MQRFMYLIGCLLTSMVGFQIHNSIFWSIVDFFFAPLVILKWIICKEVTLKIVKQSFEWFFN